MLFFLYSNSQRIATILINFSSLFSLSCMYACQVAWVVYDSLWHYSLGPATFLCPWDFPDKNTGMGCHFLLQGIFPAQRRNLHLLLPVLAGGFFTTSATWEALLKLHMPSNTCYESLLGLSFPICVPTGSFPL